MKVLVAYFSRSGNTKKVAQAIFDGIQTKKEMKELGQVDGLEGFDLAFIGFPIEAYGPAKDARLFLEKHSPGRNIALFVTHASPEDSAELQAWLADCKAPACNASLKGFFHCQGELSEMIADYMLKSNDEKLVAWAKDRPSTMGQPDGTRLERARLWANEVIRSCS
jgi:flavodoxin